MYNNTFKLIFVNIFLFSVVGISYFYGYISQYFEDDASRISYVLAFLIFLNTILTIFQSYKDEKLGVKNASEIKRWLHWIKPYMPFIGVIGTSKGLSLLFHALNVSGDPKDILTALKVGCLTLANTTLIGLIGFLWLGFNFYLIGEE